MLEHNTAKKNTAQGQTSDTQPMSPNRENRIVSTLPCPTPIRSSPYPAAQQGPTVQLLGRGSVPNPDSAPWVQSGPVTDYAPVPSQPSNMEELVVEFNKRLDQITYDKLGFMPKTRTYAKPYPEYFDLPPYPPGYRVPEFSKFNGVDNKLTWEHISKYLAQLGEANQDRKSVV